MRSSPRSENKRHRLSKLCLAALQYLQLPETDDAKSTTQNGVEALKATTRNAIQNWRELINNANSSSKSDREPDCLVSLGHSILLGVLLGILLIYLRPL